MSWDAATPADSESVRNGATRIRELKVDIAAAFTAEGSFPGTDVANPKFRWTPTRGVTGSRPGSPVTGQLYINTTLGVIERYSSTTWEPVATLIPATTVMIFFQATAPIGWTQVVTHTDKVLRVVSGTGAGSGGTDSISSPPTHTHTMTDNDVAVATSPATGDSAAHNSIVAGATTGFSPKYIDVIVCTKD